MTDWMYVVLPFLIGTCVGVIIGSALEGKNDEDN